jgi:hypothetical protein
MHPTHWWAILAGVAALVSAVPLDKKAAQPEPTPDELLKRFYYAHYIDDDSISKNTEKSHSRYDASPDLPCYHEYLGVQSDVVLATDTATALMSNASTMRITSMMTL